MRAEFTVVGVPIPQGSKTAFVVRGRAVITDGKRAPSLREWRSSVAACARLWLQQNGMPAPMDGPLRLTVIFYLPRPASAPRRVMYPATKPDCDKLLRSVGDALSKVLYTDDARLVSIIAHKRFAVDSPPRAEIALEPMAEFDARLAREKAGAA